MCFWSTHRTIPLKWLMQIMAPCTHSIGYSHARTWKKNKAVKDLKRHWSSQILQKSHKVLQLQYQTHLASPCLLVVVEWLRNNIGSLEIYASTYISAKQKQKYLYCTYELLQFPVKINTRGSKTHKTVIPFHKTMICRYTVSNNKAYFFSQLLKEYNVMNSKLF